MGKFISGEVDIAFRFYQSGSISNGKVRIKIPHIDVRLIFLVRSAGTSRNLQCQRIIFIQKSGNKRTIQCREVYTGVSLFNVEKNIDIVIDFIRSEIQMRKLFRASIDNVDKIGNTNLCISPIEFICLFNLSTTIIIIFNSIRKERRCHVNANVIISKPLIEVCIVTNFFQVCISTNGNKHKRSSCSIGILFNTCIQIQSCHSQRVEEVGKSLIHFIPRYVDGFIGLWIS